MTGNLLTIQMAIVIAREKIGRRNFEKFRKFKNGGIGMKKTENIASIEKLSTLSRETDNSLYLQIKEILNTARKKA